jgi:hypothetical protein
MLTIAAVAAALIVPVGAQAHDKGCKTERCDDRIGAIWSREHPPSLPRVPVGLARCIADRESTNGLNERLVPDNLFDTDQFHSGLAQWNYDAWVADGGLRFGRGPDGVSYRQQLWVLNAGLRRHGCRQWCPFDGC